MILGSENVFDQQILISLKILGILGIIGFYKGF